MKHVNSGACGKCAEIFNRYPKFNLILRTWFEKQQHAYHPFHISDAGRGHIEQETYFNRKSSLAHWGQSAHNYGCAIDTFFLIDGKYSLSVNLYNHYIIPSMPSWIEWGARWKSFPELPHFELSGWRALAKTGQIVLVEPVPITLA